MLSLHNMTRLRLEHSAHPTFPRSSNAVERRAWEDGRDGK